ncbi:MAG: hypothetical protein KCHDKBKB_00387 [Elusimicrobia bacterium]|nr:hypothetical protein [Elusimicrobiota bacterium]
MTTLEEEVLIPLKRQMAHMKNVFPIKRKLGPWAFVLAAATGLFLGGSVGGLILLKNETFKAWSGAINSYDWLVLAEGDSVALDEVGRYLKKIDGVSEVTFQSAEEILEVTKMDSKLAENLKLIEGNPFPSAWRVRWQAEYFSPVKIHESAEEVKLFPGVVDVASDPRALEVIQTYRGLWHQVKLVLSLMGAFFSILLSVLVVRMTLGSKSSWWSIKNVASVSAVTFFSFGVGAALLYFLW